MRASVESLTKISYNQEKGIESIAELLASQVDKADFDSMMKNKPYNRIQENLVEKYSHLRWYMNSETMMNITQGRDDIDIEELLMSEDAMLHNIGVSYNEFMPGLEAESVEQDQYPIILGNMSVFKLHHISRPYIHRVVNAKSHRVEFVTTGYIATECPDITRISVLAI